MWIACHLFTVLLLDLFLSIATGKYNFNDQGGEDFDEAINEAIDSELGGADSLLQGGAQHAAHQMHHNPMAGMGQMPRHM